MKLLRIPKLPKFKMPRRRKEPPQQLDARVRASTDTMDGYGSDEPETKLTGALIVVAIIHVLSVLGIYAFNQIRSSRRVPEPPPVETKTIAQKPSALVSQQAQIKSAEIQPAPATAPVAPVLKQRVYNVKPGDTLTGIAKNFNVVVADLKAANGMSNDVIRIGQVLNLPSARQDAAPPPAPAKPAETATRTYTVKSGDRLIFIAKKYGVSQEDLVALNKIKDPAKLQIGQTLKVPAKK